MESTHNRSQLVPVELEDGTTIQVSATPLRGFQEVSTDGIKHQIGEVTQTIKSIAKSIGDVLQEVKPDKATVEFGIEIGVEPGKLTALLVKGTATANLKISLEWSK